MRRWLVLGLLLLAAYGVYEYATLPDAAPLARENPRTTALIQQREAEAREAGRKPRRRQSWVSLGAISRYARSAVLLSEDANFYTHGGVDWGELRNALAEAWEEGKLGRGASTITQQLAKNLWLSTDRSLVRKAKELVLAYRLEEALTKHRILTLYLNVIEWGHGVYGIEAGAREHFGTSAASLTPAQAAILAAMLPAPRQRTLGSRSRALRRHAHLLIDRMRSADRVTAEQARAAHVEIDQRLGWRKAEEHGPEDDDDEG